jgi:hypothetical protein
VLGRERGIVADAAKRLDCGGRLEPVAVLGHKVASQAGLTILQMKTAYFDGIDITVDD